MSLDIWALLLDILHDILVYSHYMINHDKDAENQILTTVGRLEKSTVAGIISNLPTKVSRQWVSTLLNKLALEGKLARSKVGKHVFYVLPDRLDLIGKKISRSYVNDALNEDIVFEQLKTQALLLQKLDENLDSIVRFGFTEMLNNAIEHSKSRSIEVSISEEGNNIVFEILDAGIGAFRSIMQKKGLHSELEAIQELLKGKTTTLPHSHTGEGIFFTSKIADVFILDTFEYRLRIDNLIKDVFIEKIINKPGTKVRFELSKDSNKHLNDIFKEYEAEPGSFAFDKTTVRVKLFKAGTVYISRSQARRLMVNLDKFKLVLLDFEGVKTVGQAFADEVFRVFAKKYPNTKLQPINMSETVDFMVSRVDSG